MNTLRKNGIMWILLLSALMLVGAILILIFALDRHTEVPSETKDYTEDIRALNDTIVKLQKEIEAYEEMIVLIDLERDALKKEVREIINRNEKTDSIIVSNNLDANIRFLTDYLSKSDSSGGGYFGMYYPEPTDDSKQDDKP